MSSDEPSFVITRNALFAMGTECEIQLFGRDPNETNSIALAAITEIDRIEQTYTRYDLLNLAAIYRSSAPNPMTLPGSSGFATRRRLTKASALFKSARGGFATSGDYERFFEIDGRR